MKRPSIISLGEVLWDLFPDGEQFGGAPANFACHAAIQGADVTMASAVGNDSRGISAVEILRQYNIDDSLIQITHKAPTGTVGVDLDNNGKPTFVIHEGSAWDRLQWSNELAERIAEADAIYFGTLGQRSEISRETIRQGVELAASVGTLRVLDINLRAPFYDVRTIRESVRLASILKLSDDELIEVCAACGVSTEHGTESALRCLLAFGDLDAVVMTRGADGALFVTSDESIAQDGVPASVIDTVGAGDSFTAAFLIGELGEGSHQQNLRIACEVAAATCSHSGAVP